MELKSSSVPTILSRMGDSGNRNLFFAGHGNTDSISGKADGARISADQVAATVLQPYRLVFLTCCCTAKGYMCERFGISREALSNKEFEDHGLRPRAFVGSPLEADAPLGTTFPRPPWLDGAPKTVQETFLASDTEQAAIITLFRSWRYGDRLDEALAKAKKRGLDSSYVIYGARDLTMFGP